MSQINLAAIQSVRGQLVLHAGAVADPSGDCLLVCGASGAGKSTLTANLVGRLGLAYLTDETVAMRPFDLRITPYRKPLQLKRGSHPVLPHLGPAEQSVRERVSWHQWLVPPSALGGPPPPDRPLTPRMVLLPQFTSGSPSFVERVSELELAALVSAQASMFPDIEGGGLEAVARLGRRTAPAYRVVFGDVDTATDAVARVWAQR
jgi:hypothetical protein